MPFFGKKSEKKINYIALEQAWNHDLAYLAPEIDSSIDHSGEIERDARESWKSDRDKFNGVREEGGECSFKEVRGNIMAG